MPLPDGAIAGLVVHKPDGSTVRLAPGSTSFAETDQPGIYTVETAEGARDVRREPRPAGEQDRAAARRDAGAVRLPAGESHRAATSTTSELRQMQNAELEGRQKLWRWLILAAIGS